MRLVLTIGLILAAACICCAQATQPAKIDLRILYAGHLGSPRETDFAGFLREHFREVKTGDLASFDGRQAEGFDVVLIDYDGDGFKAPHPALPEAYARPTVTIGGADKGSGFVDRRGTRDTRLPNLQRTRDIFFSTRRLAAADALGQPFPQSNL